MIIGLILGDGTLVKKYANGNTYFQYAQGLVHADYIKHIFDIFSISGYCNKVDLSTGKVVVKDKEYQYLNFKTKSLLEFNILRSLFYPKGKKVIPPPPPRTYASRSGGGINIGDLLTPISIAYWIQDDGSFSFVFNYSSIHLLNKGYMVRRYRGGGSPLQD